MQLLPQITITHKELQENPQIKPKNEIFYKETSPPVLESNIQGKELAFIRRKREYRAFIRLIKANKFTSAVFSARLLGVNQHTIREWLNTPLALRALEETSSQYIKDIEEAKDWKAKAYLLDTLKGNEEEQEKKQDLKQLIVINT